MIIIGIDPGYERLGIAILVKEKNQKEKILYSECFKTKANISFEKRLLLIGNKISKIIDLYRPDALAIETLFSNTNQKTVMRVSESRGVVIYECAKRNLTIFEASPPQIKMAITGYGHAEKSQVMKMVKMLVNIDKTKKSDDELDAIAIALTGLAHIK